MSGLSIVAEGAGRYVHWGVIQISQTNLIIIGVIAIIEDALFKLIKRVLFPYSVIAERA